MLLLPLLALRALAQDPAPSPPAETPPAAPAAAVEDPPEATPPPPTQVVIQGPTGPVSPWTGTPQALARYERLRLRLVDTPSAGGFVVRDGNGYSYDAWAFARATLDQATLDVLEERARHARLESFFVIGGGALLASLSVVPLLFIEDVRGPDQSDYVLDPNDFPSDDSYQAAQADATALYELALLQTQSVAGQNENRRWTALTLGSTGTLVMFAGTIHHDRRVSELVPLTELYGRTRAEELVEQYNAGLRGRLGVLPAEGYEPPTPPADAPPSEGEGDELDERPNDPEPDDTDPGDPPDEVPASGGPAEPLRPAPPLQIAPFVAPGMVGLRGRF